MNHPGTEDSAGTPVEYRWVLPEPIRPQLLPVLPGLPPLAAELLYRRGYRTAEAISAFLEPSAAQLSRPDDLPDIAPATERLCRAVQAAEAVLVAGDYDADGLTATALLVTALRRLGLPVYWHIPDRAEEGYGFSQQAVATARAHGVRLIVTVDCGTSDHAAVTAARAAGIDIIVTDHHEPRSPEAPLPPALAVVNPRRPDANAAFADLAGVGVAFKLAWSILARLGRPREELTDLFDLLTIGTIADVVPLTGENRIIARLGLPAVQRSRRPGIQALLAAARVPDRPLRSRDVSFMLAPRLNAAGRIGHARDALQLLLSEDPTEASALAQELDRRNRRRQSIEEKLIAESLQQAGHQIAAGRRTLVVAGDNWPDGIVGILASRLVDRFHRPTIVIALHGQHGRGSGRSIPGFDLHAAVASCAATLERFGGHRAAVGITIAADRIPEFSDGLEAAAALVPSAVFAPALTVDATARLSALDDPLLTALDRFEPFGTGNEPPVLATPAVEIVTAPVALGRNGLRFVVRDGDNLGEAVCWNADRLHSRFLAVPASRCDICYTPARHQWNGCSRIRLEVLDLRPAQE